MLLLCIQLADLTNLSSLDLPTLPASYPTSSPAPPLYALSEVFPRSIHCIAPPPHSQRAMIKTNNKNSQCFSSHIRRLILLGLESGHRSSPSAFFWRLIRSHWVKVVDVSCAVSLCCLVPFQGFNAWFKQVLCLFVSVPDTAETPTSASWGHLTL